MSVKHHGARLQIDGKEIAPIGGTTFALRHREVPSIEVNMIRSQTFLDEVRRAYESGDVLFFEDGDFECAVQVAEIFEEEIDDDTNIQITFRVVDPE